MNSKSMQSDGAKAQGGTVPYGAVALVSRLKGLSVRRGGLVLVELSNEGQRIKTIRRVVAIPGDPIPDSTGITAPRHVVPAGYYYLVAESTNALDSRTMGVLSAT